jgi:inner membrane protein
MDNVCHTLLGAACARAGFVGKTRFAAVTSMIAANLPDLDVLVFAVDVPSVAFRRGWTHGVLAQAALPALLAWAVLVIGRSTRRDAAANAPPTALKPLLVLSYLGVLSHVFLDYLNNYGVRLLMPFSDRWFYGDALFIIDPWLWVVFGAAALAGRHGSVRSARFGLLVAAVYILCMIGSARAARSMVLDAWQRDFGTPQELMVGPVPVTPFRKALIIDAGDHYRTGAFTWSPRLIAFSDTRTAKNDTDPAAQAARADPRVSGILTWSRFPFWTIEPESDGRRVTVRDMRFRGIGRGGFTATVVVR